MGSIIQATPLLLALRNRYPDAEIIFVSTKANEKLLKNIKTIDTIIFLDDSGIVNLLRTFSQSIIKLIKKRPGVYIDLEIYSDFSTIFTLFTLSKNRLGFYLRSSSYRLGIYTHMMFFNPRMPINEVYMQMARLLGYRGLKPDLFPLHQNIPSSAQLPEKPYILINPNASDLRIERRWGENNFVSLIKILLEKYPGYDIFLIGSPSERTYTQSIQNQLPSEGVGNMAGKTSLDQLILLIKNARMLITNDTGPMHIAFSTQTPTVCLFGPCAPEQYGDNPKAYILYNKVYCSPCVHDFEIPPCKGNNVCMQKISVNDVLEKTKKILVESLPDDYTPGENIYYNNHNTLGLIER